MDQTNETRLGSAPLGKLLFQLGLPDIRFIFRIIVHF